ncbi:MAG: rhomboid family intramembrane serine protease [Anaerolineae bacterium]|nr:rhomboid family intramembrane serine protease [Anaerolineae bacterium]
MDWVAKHPFTTVLFLLIFATGIFTGTALGHKIPVSVQNTWGTGPQKILDGKWWTIFTMVFFCNDAFMLYGVILAGVPILALAESTLGTWVTMIAYWATQVIVWLVIAVIFHRLMVRGVAPGPDVYPMTDIGLSVGLFGVIGVLVVALNRSPGMAQHWQTIALEAGVPLYLVLKWILMPEWLADTGHWMALLLGIAAGLLFRV